MEVGGAGTGSSSEANFTIVARVHGQRQVVEMAPGEGGYGGKSIISSSFSFVTHPPPRT